MNKKRRPIVSIIITADNNSRMLSRCLESFFHESFDIWKLEFIIINNYKDDQSSKDISQSISDYHSSFFNILLFQAPHKISNAQAWNLGKEFAKGSWLYFMDSSEKATRNFASFLNDFKFDLKIDFYRIPVISETKKKQKIGFFKSKFFSSVASSLIINEEFLTKNELKWDSYIEYGENILMIARMYTIRNVNYLYLKRSYSVYHDFFWDKKRVDEIEFTSIIKSCQEFLKEKKYSYKQNILFLLTEYFYYVKDRNKKIIQNKSNIKNIFKQGKINLFSFFLLSPKVFFSAIQIWIKTLF